MTAADAERLFREAVELHRAGRLAEAAARYAAALALRPKDLRLLVNRGAALQALGDAAGALDAFERARALTPPDPDIEFNRGCALAALGRPADALAAFDAALALRPDDPEALVNRANALGELQRHDEALAAFDRAGPAGSTPDALNGRGAALRGLGRLADSVDAFSRALAAQPAHRAALENRAGALFALGRLDEAARDYERVVADRPPAGPPTAAANPHAQLLLTRRMMCAWRDIGSIERIVLEQAAGGEPPVSPITLLSVSDDPALQRVCAGRAWERRRPAAAMPLARGRAPRRDRIRIGYLSCEMRDHALMRLMAELFELHDRDRFATFAYSYGPGDGSAMRTRLERAFDRFSDVRRIDDESLARRIAADGIDLLVDLSGYVQGNRIGVLAWRPAPVLAAFLGYPGTLGAGAVDYLVADRFLIPPGAERHYAEALAFLPDSYQANDSKRAVADATPSRGASGLPEDGFVFCCFNNNFKITPAVFDVWMRLLRALPDAVLWLLADNRWAEANLRREAEARGVAGARLVFAPRAPLADHLARQRLADLFLDTLPYNAHTTASDALWVGLPVLTCAGRAFAARVAGSLLRAVGLPELITTSLEEYEALALALARDPPRLAALRARLAAARDTAPLFDADRFRRHLERAYATMHDAACRGEKPRSFAVEAVA